MGPNCKFIARQILKTVPREIQESLVDFFCFFTESLEIDPNLNKSYLNNWEIAKIYEMQQNYGNKWVMIAKKLDRRTDNMVKNFWYSSGRNKSPKYYVKLKEVEEFSEESDSNEEDVVFENNPSQFPEQRIKDRPIFSVEDFLEFCGSQLV